MEQEAIYFGENSIIKSAFHKNKKPININDADTKKIVLFHKSHMINIYLNTLLGTDMKVMLFYHHCM